MSLYAIGDLHLHFDSVCKSLDQQRGVWTDHEEKVMRHCRAMVGPEDTLVLAGDHSWGATLSSCQRDLDFIAQLPGRKILLRGNHDRFWDAKKTRALNERYAGTFFFLQNNYAPYGDIALVGTKGYTFEGPFYLDRQGRVVGWDEEAAAQAEKLVAREAERLRQSFEAARADGYRRFIMFLHYPPTNIMEKRSAFTDMAEAYGARMVVYAHCHGEARFHDSLMGKVRGVEYRLVSGDYLRWIPERLM